MKAREHVAKLVSFLSSCFPGFGDRVTAELVAAWSAALGEYSEDQLARAGHALAQHFRFGLPSTRDVVEAIEGRVVRRPVFVTDAWGNRLLKFPGGPPLIEGYAEVRVPYGTVVDEGGQAGELPTEGPGQLGRGDSPSEP